MTNQGLQVKLKHDFAEGLIKLIDNYLALEYLEDDEKLIICGLAEIRHRLYMRVEKFQKEYTLTLSPVQAISLRLFYTDFINETSTYMGSKLHLISNEVAKKYQS